MFSAIHNPGLHFSFSDFVENFWRVKFFQFDPFFVNFTDLFKHRDNFNSKPPIFVITYALRELGSSEKLRAMSTFILVRSYF
jgi:hypothetical protein